MDSSTSINEKQETPCCCNFRVFNDAEKQRHSQLMIKLRAATLETKELVDGYAFQMDPSVVSITEIAEWITYERRCCSFFNFDIALHSNGESLALKLRGGPEVKEFLHPDVKQNAVFDPKF